ncbi:MAG TPA: helix-turn-helix transcriptional regulator [Gemmatimonadales bacterium]
MKTQTIHRALADPEILGVLGARLRAYRGAHGLTLADLADRAGLSHPTLQKAETGGNFTMRTLLRVLRALGRIEQLDAFLPPVTASPLALLEDQRGD